MFFDLEYPSSDAFSHALPIHGLHSTSVFLPPDLVLGPEGVSRLVLDPAVACQMCTSAVDDPVQLCLFLLRRDQHVGLQGVFGEEDEVNTSLQGVFGEEDEVDTSTLDTIIRTQDITSLNTNHSPFITKVLSLIHDSTPLPTLQAIFQACAPRLVPEHVYQMFVSLEVSTYTTNTMYSYVAGLSLEKQPVDAKMACLLVSSLLSLNRVMEVKELVLNHVVSDSVDVAMRLMGDEDQALYQIGRDMLSRLHLWPQMVAQLLENGDLDQAVRVCLRHGSALHGVSPPDFLRACEFTHERNPYPRVHHFYAVAFPELLLVQAHETTSLLATALLNRFPCNAAFQQCYPTVHDKALLREAFGFT